ncbi:MAG TPA: hypothetical protein VHC19_09395 [Pirellulales bacterium]|nr:hypothetical protein [Pirellulales bacterium]
MKASPSAPESKPADLPAARKELAKLIATEMALEKERDERGRYLKQFKAAPQAEYKSDFRAAIDEQMAAAEKEADALDLEHVALRRKELEDRRNARRKAAARLLAEAKSAAAAADVALAFERTSGYLLVASPEELPSAVTLLRELDQADPWVLYARLVDAPLAELQRVIAEGRLPDGWPKPPEEPAVIEAVRNSAVRLAPMVLSMAQTTQLLEEFVKTEAKLDLAKRRKLLFLFEADKLHDSGELDEGNVKRLVGDFGTFKADDLSPLIDSVLARDSRETGEDTARDYVPAVARGDIKRISLRQLYDECRKTAGDAWPADDQPHPLAGMWEGPSQWQVHIDPPQEEIALLRASPKVRIVQRLCKIGPDYLVAYENRAADQRESSNYPFPAGKLLGPHPLLKFGDFFADGGAVDFTYYALAKDGRMLAIRRRTTTSAHVRENMGREFWRTLDKSQGFREWPDEFRRVDAKAQP